MAPTPLAPGELIHERYRIIRQIGQGGMGAVYEATDERLGNRVALKQTIVSGDRLERAFEREARILAGLRHPALPVVSDYFDISGNQFLVMQYIPGDDLANLLHQRGGPFAPHEVLRWANSLLDALDYLHNQDQPIIHRDIKPQNLKPDPRGEIVLLDFGLAKGAVQSNTASTESIIGYTPQYAPLEQIRGTGTDARSDLYALAATLHHLLTGVPPSNALDRAAAIYQNQPDPLHLAHELNPQVPPAISTALSRALSINPAERPASAAEFRTLLNSATRQAASTGSTIVFGQKTEIRTPEIVPVQPAPVFHSPTPHASAPLIIGLLVLGMIGVLGALAYFGLRSAVRTFDPVPPPIAVIAPITPVLEVDPTQEPISIVIPTIPAIPKIPLIETILPQPTAPAESDSFAQVIFSFGKEGTGQGLFQDARAIAVDPQGNIYVGEYETGRIQRFDQKGQFQGGWMSEGEAPLQSIAADRDGHLYAVRSGKILKYEGATGKLLATFDSNKDSYQDLTVMPDGNLLAFSYRGEDNLVILSPAGKVLEQIENVISGQTDNSELEIDVAVDGLGRIFALGQFNGAVFRFSAEGKFEDKVTTAGPLELSALAVDGQSRVYVVSGFSTINVFDIDGKSIAQIKSVKGAIRSMTFDQQGDLYVVTSEQKVYKLRVSGGSANY